MHLNPAGLVALMLCGWLILRAIEGLYWSLASRDAD